MAAFMDESGVETRNGRTHRGALLRPNFKVIALRQGLFPRHRFSSQQIPNPPAQQQSLASDYDVYPAGIITQDFISKGGDIVMC